MSRVIEHLIEQEVIRAESQEGYAGTALVACRAEGMMAVATVTQTLSVDKQDEYLRRLNAARAKSFGSKAA